LFSFSFVDLPSVLWYCWLCLLTCKNRLLYNLYCVGGDVKHCPLTHSSIKEFQIYGAATMCGIKLWLYCVWLTGDVMFAHLLLLITVISCLFFLVWESLPYRSLVADKINFAYDYIIGTYCWNMLSVVLFRFWCILFKSYFIWKC